MRGSTNMHEQVTVTVSGCTATFSRQDERHWLGVVTNESGHVLGSVRYDKSDSKLLPAAFDPAFLEKLESAIKNGLGR
jgi:hypothetical protein